MKVYTRIVLSQNFIAMVGAFVLLSFLVMPAMALDRFLNNGDGTITDRKSGLMWAKKDNGIPINWPNALSYCHNYSGGGHDDWRMPTIAATARGTSLNNQIMGSSPLLTFLTNSGS